MKSEHPIEPIHILLVEDNEGDIMLTTEALEEAKILSKLSVIKDGKEAIEFAGKVGKYGNADVPDLILLDINLPKKNGHEVLTFIKKSDHLKHIPVIMLTTSSAEKDIDMAYKHYANCYIIKPVNVIDFVSVIATIENFWISIVKLSNKENN